MSKINIQISIDDSVQFTKSIKVIDTNTITEQGLIELLTTINTRTIEILKARDIIATLKTKVTTHLINFCIDGKKIPIDKLSDILKYTFKYLIDNNYINKFNPALRWRDNSNKFIYNNKPKHTNHNTMTHSFEHNGFYLDLNMNRSSMKQCFDILIEHFRVTKKQLDLQNWPN